MSSSQQPSKTSRWGSLLQQAVAGVESRLDTILTDADGPPNKPAKAPETIAQQPTRKETITATPSLKVEDGEDHGYIVLTALVEHALIHGPGRSRTRSNSKTNDRLQERLARAMAGKDIARTGRSPAPSSGVPSRTTSPALGVDDAQHEAETKAMGPEATREGPVSLEGTSRETVETGHLAKAETRVEAEVDAETRTTLEDQHLLAPTSTNDVPSGIPVDSRSTSQTRQSQESAPDVTVISSVEDNEQSILSQTETSTKTADEYEALLSQLRSDYETAEIRRQDEVHTYTERIDALQAKLKLLSREAAESARNAAATAPKGSLEGKLAEREEQIALLMDEGLKLSETELKNMNTIKKLRGTVNEKEKALSETQRKLEKAEKSSMEAREKMKRAEASEKRANDRLKAYSKLEKEVDALRTERDSNNLTIASLKAQVAQTNAKAVEDDRRAQTAALEAERKLISELRESLSKANTEKERAQEKARAEIRELKEKAEREKKRHRIAEIELRHEQSVSGRPTGFHFISVC